MDSNEKEELFNDSKAGMILTNIVGVLFFSCPDFVFNTLSATRNRNMAKQSGGWSTEDIMKRATWRKEMIAIMETVEDEEKKRIIKQLLDQESSQFTAKSRPSKEDRAAAEACCKEMGIKPSMVSLPEFNGNFIDYQKEYKPSSFRN